MEGGKEDELLSLFPDYTDPAPATSFYAVMRCILETESDKPYLLILSQDREMN